MYTAARTVWVINREYPWEYQLWGPWLAITLHQEPHIAGLYIKEIFLNIARFRNLNKAKVPKCTELAQDHLCAKPFCLGDPCMSGGAARVTMIWTISKILNGRTNVDGTNGSDLKGVHSKEYEVNTTSRILLHTGHSSKLSEQSLSSPLAAPFPLFATVWTFSLRSSLISLYSL